MKIESESRMKKEKNRSERLKISIEAALVAAFLYYIADFRTITAVLLAAAVHELGHVGALHVLGMRITGFRAELKGFCIDYEGEAGWLGHALAAFAGPLAGLAYALAASAAGHATGEEWFHLTAGISMILSGFNMLPALPLDGGRMLQCGLCAALGEEEGEKIGRMISTVTGTILLAGGIYLMAAGGGIALLLAAIWLLAYQNDGEGIEKKGEIL